MPANTQPIFSLTPNIGAVAIPTAAANTKSDGTGTLTTDIFKLFTAGLNGSLIDKIRFSAVASAAATTSVATVLRVFFSTIGAGGTTSADTHLLAEVSVPAVAADHSTNANPYYEVALGMAIPAGSFIHVSQHVAQTANQSWRAVAIGADY